MKGGWVLTLLMWILLYWAVLSKLIASWLLLQEWKCHLEDHLRRNHCSILELILDDDTCYRLQVSWGSVLPNMKLKLSHMLQYWVGNREWDFQLNISIRSFVDPYLVEAHWSVGTSVLYQLWSTPDEFWTKVLWSTNLVGPWVLLVECHSMAIHWKSWHFHQTQLQSLLWYWFL